MMMKIRFNFCFNEFWSFRIYPVYNTSFRQDNWLPEVSKSLVNNPLSSYFATVCLKMNGRERGGREGMMINIHFNFCLNEY